MISVIVPVFQREKFIKKSIDSILCQSHKDFELIIVDDGSTDQTAEICRQYSENDSRIRVITHEQNIGLLGARQTGVDEALGDYICFIDSDDTVAPDYLSKLALFAKESNADIVITGYKLLFNDSEVSNIFENLPPQEYDMEPALCQMIINKYFSWEMVGKLYRSYLIKEYCFPQGFSIAEDLVNNWELFHMARSFYYYPYSGYYYHKHCTNMTQNNHLIRRDYVKAFSLLIDTAHKSGKAWELLLNKIESILLNTLDKWISSDDPSDGNFEGLQYILKRVMEEKAIVTEDINPERSEYFLPLAEAKLLRENEYKELLDEMIGFSKKSKSIYIFGNGVWSKRIRDILEMEGIKYNGFVLSDEMYMRTDKKSNVYTLGKLDEEDAVIVCTSESVIDGVLKNLRECQIKYLNLTDRGNIIKYGLNRYGRGNPV